MADTCAVCHRPWSLWVRAKEWRKGNSTATWQWNAGGSAICDKCVKTNADTIRRHNADYYRQSGEKKDPSCLHDWAHPFPARWSCRKCHAEYNWMCGHGGSAYVCETDYRAFLEKALAGHGSVEAFLAEKSW